MNHTAPHPLSGATVRVRPKSPHQFLVTGAQLQVEDWYDRVTGSSPLIPTTFATMNYLGRVATDSIPANDDVVYGKIGGLGYLVHVTELDESEST